MTCSHVKIQLLECLYDTKKYDIVKYTYCNNCGDKMDDMVLIGKKDHIPDGDKDVITKVICNVESNGYQYALFGHEEDRRFYIEHGHKWK